MSEYFISKINYNNKRELNQMEKLLQQEGIERDKNLDYSAGMFDEDYQLVATGSCFRNTLRCLAVDSSHQGEGLLNQIISHLIQFQYDRGQLDLFLYTKCNTAKFFGDLGFYEISRVDGKVVFMENRKNGFTSYLNQLKSETDLFMNQHPELNEKAELISGAVIMNANPFTLGHQYLIEQASSQCDVLHVFVVSEDVSLVPFTVRTQLVKEGSRHLKNIICHQTGNYMISSATFPSYFLKDSSTVIESHAKLDINIFKNIANELTITKRFVGEEPFSQVTGIYNQVMKEELEKAGLSCIIIPRKQKDGIVISASTVRKAIQEQNLPLLHLLLPATTLQYLESPAGKELVEKIISAGDVVHY